MRLATIRTAGGTRAVRIDDDGAVDLGVVVGAPLRHASLEEARSAIAGYTVVNDVTGRDYQYRSVQWLQGKTFQSSTPVGPYLVTAESIPGGEPGEITCEVDGEVVQHADTADLVFPPAELLAYLSRIITLVPGDLVATGTPGGVGHARKPPRYLTDGAVLTTRIAGVGECRNVCRAEKSYG